MSFEYMEDCLHLKACRRLSKVCKTQLRGASISRGCNDSCSAYLNGAETDYISVEEAVNYARDCVARVSDADVFDVCSPLDLQGKTLNDIVEEG